MNRLFASIVKLIAKFKQNGQVTDEKLPVPSRIVWLAQKIAAVAESAAEIPGLSISRRSQFAI